MHESQRRPARLLAPVFLISMSLFLVEIASTRMLSVIMAYHFAVLSISLAMLGLTVGGVAVFVYRDRIAEVGPVRVASTLAMVCALGTAGSLLSLLGLPVQPMPTLAGLMNFALLFLPQAVPYLSGGMAIAVVLAFFPDSIGQLYLADLSGAALGCLVAAWGLPVGGGSGTILLAALLCALAGFLLEQAAWPWRLPKGLHSRAWLVVLGASVSVAVLTGSFEIGYVKGIAETDAEWIRWTPHSRLSVSRENVSRAPFGWGYGQTFSPGGRLFGFRRIRIDGMAETPITRWNGSPDELQFLLWDVTSVPFQLKRGGGDALIVGSGGGRDILTAAISGGWRVQAAEINEGIVAAMNGSYLSYSGGVYRLPNVRTQVIDGRSAIEQMKPASLDLVQLSAVDTWALGSRNAFALMENSLYTVECFRAALRALRPDGYLSISRFKYPQDSYGETVRMVAVGLAALDESGIAPPSEAGRHVVLVTNRRGDEFGIATMLVKPTVFSPAEIVQTRELCAVRGFTLVWSAEGGMPSNPATLLLGLPDRAAQNEFWRKYPIDVSPSRDDRPFFLHQSRLRDVVRGSADVEDAAALRLAPVLTVLRLALFLLVMCAGLIAYPMFSAGRNLRRAAAPRAVVYFASLGFGFMLYELPLVQGLTLGLGHPTRSLTVVLFALLLGAGGGSLLTTRVPERLRRGVHTFLTIASVGVGLAIASGGPSLTQRMFQLSMAARVAMAGALVGGIGLVLGTLLPLGMRSLLKEGDERAVAYCWAANGAAGLLASVAGLLLNLEVGMKATTLVGCVFYLVACASIVWPSERRPAESVTSPDS